MYIVFVVVGVVAHLHVLSLFVFVALLHHLLLIVVVVRAGAASLGVLLEEQRDGACEQLERDLVVVRVLAARSQEIDQHFIRWEYAHAAEECLEGVHVHKLFAGLRGRLEGLAQVDKLHLGEHLVDGDVLGSELRPLSLGALHGSLEDARGIGELELVDGREHVGVGEEGLLVHLLDLVIFDLGVDAGLGLVADPLTDEEFVLVVVEVAALALSEVVDPVALEVIAVPLGEHAVAVAFALVPLALVDVLVRVYHSALALGHARDPVPVVPVPVLVEEGAATVLLVLVPVARVLSPQLACLVAPVSALTVTLITLPQSFVFVSILVELNAEAVLLILLPIADVPAGVHPLLALDAPVLLPLLLLDPVDGAVRAVLLRLAVTRLPQLRERRLHLRVLHLRCVVVRVAAASSHATVIRQTLNSYKRKQLFLLWTPSIKY